MRLPKRQLFEIGSVALDQKTDNETEESEDRAKDFNDKNLDKPGEDQLQRLFMNALFLTMRDLQHLLEQHCFH